MSSEQSAPRPHGRYLFLAALATLPFTLWAINRLSDGTRQDGMDWLLALFSVVPPLLLLFGAMNDPNEAPKWVWRARITRFLTLLAAGWGLLAGLSADLFSARGRPVRLRGRPVRADIGPDDEAWQHEELRPDVDGLDAVTRSVLAELWLHDAIAEHASVPAFARLAWLLSTVGAPSQLLRLAHRRRSMRSITRLSAFRWRRPIQVERVVRTRCPSSPLLDWAATAVPRRRCCARAFSTVR